MSCLYLAYRHHGCQGLPSKRRVRTFQLVWGKVP
nr:MAG TPA: hypothetical protein [Caudoviricetes sp.]DAY34104.1 MAG TPA: hypothetical protein [Caudoviricetes sp.]